MQKLSSSERDLITQNLEKYTLVHPARPAKVVSTWYSSTFHFVLSRNGGLVVSILFVTIISSSSFLLAKNSLPGDTLYPLKVDVIEPLEYSLAVDSVAKTNILLSNLDTRIKEVEALEVGGKLTDSIQSDIENRLKNNTKKIAEVSNKNKIVNNKTANKNTKATQVSQDTSLGENIESAEPSLMMMAVSDTVATASPATSSEVSRRQGVKKTNKADKIIKSTKASVERIKKVKNSNKKLINIAEESIKDAENSIREMESDNRDRDRDDR